ncbi:uncharacterized protein LOC114433543 isoform X2 [Parambassis ranga]|uniref:Uncharacterized protein LOC114433543 isoform X2 n=1 Tax=Parambassis ranga TaxID=210632 RepID=A0A6P7I0G5_9TELE|nr:uncharacterized protein LOC114433543 isoform X2 [Parambassis ranga]
MFDAWALLFLLLQGSLAFNIQNPGLSLCLEDSAETSEVLLRKCNRGSESQQWVWINQSMLMCVASFRCLSAQQRDPVQTQLCHNPGVDAAGLMWDCDQDRLISRSTLLVLSTNGQHAILTYNSQFSKWRSLDKVDICHGRQRLKRTSDDSAQAEALEGQTDELAPMTKEQRDYLCWYYRTEDPTTWKLVLLGLAFICLLLGFLLLGMGTMANKSRKKIAKYKAAASLVRKHEGEELQAISLLRGSNISPSGSLGQGNKPSMSNRDISELTAGNIVVTWRDGNTSHLYSDPKEDKKQGETQEEDSSANLGAYDRTKVMK